MSLKSELQSIVENLAESSFGLGTGAEPIRGDINADEAVSQILDLLDKSLVRALDELRPPKEYEEFFKLAGQDSCVICGFSPTKMNTAIDDVRKVIKEGTDEEV